MQKVFDFPQGGAIFCDMTPEDFEDEFERAMQEERRQMSVGGCWLLMAAFDLVILFAVLYWIC